MGRPSSYEHAASVVIAAKAEGKRDTVACFEAGITTRTLYNWLNDKPGFRAKYEAAQAAGVLVVEARILAKMNKDVEGRIKALVATFPTQVAA